jgi:MATE family multidrug resistance protein
MRAYFRVAVPTAILIWSEWWVFEIMALLAATFGPAAIAAHTAANTLLQVLFMVPLSLGSAATNIIGNAAGTGDAQQARTATSLSLAAIIVLSALLVTLVLAASGPLSKLFTEDPEVIALLKGIFVPLAPFLLLDGVQTVLEGALRGLSLQRPAMFAKLVSMLGIRVGGAVLFAFALKMGVTGIWWGGLAGMAMTVGLYTIIFCSADVEKISSDVRQAMITKDVEESRTTASGSKVAPATTGSIVSNPSNVQSDSIVFNPSIVAGTRGEATGSFVQLADSWS